MTLVILTDEHGFHYTDTLHRKRARREETQDFIDAPSKEQLGRLYHLLILVFSNQMVIRTALGEVQEGMDFMTNPESGAIQALTDAVARGVGYEQAAVDLMGTLESQNQTLIAELASQGVTVDNSPALAALTATLDGAGQKLSDALNAIGTPVTPPVTDGSGSGSTDTAPTEDSAPQDAPTPALSGTDVSAETSPNV